MSEIITTLKSIINESLKRLYDDNFEDKIIIEVPKDKEHGDFSTNIAMKLAKELHNSPLNIAKSLVSDLKTNQLFNKVDIAGPGFINFFIKEESFTTFIKEIINENQILEKTRK